MNKNEKTKKKNHISEILHNFCQKNCQQNLMQQRFQRQITLNGTTYRTNLTTGLQGRIWKVCDDAVNFSAIKTMNENYFSYKKYENEPSNSEQINHFRDLANQLDDTIKKYIETRKLINSLYDKYPPDDWMRDLTQLLEDENSFYENHKIEFETSLRESETFNGELDDLQEKLSGLQKQLTHRLNRSFKLHQSIQDKRFLLNQIKVNQISVNNDDSN